MKRPGPSLTAALLFAIATAHGAAPGDSVETRPTNKANYKPAFAGQTRAKLVRANVAFDVQEIVKSGLVSPFGLAFLPDGRMLLSERSGALRIVAANGQLSAPISSIFPVMFEDQGGLLDVALDPDFASNRWIYWSYAELTPDKSTSTTVARAKLSDGPTPGLTQPEIIYRQMPRLASQSHFGSRLVFDNAKRLFITQGELAVAAGRPQAQDLTSLLGKVVRIERDGKIPKDNPFVGRADARPEIWSYGHRNVQGAFRHPVTGELWTIEHGPQGGDEINIARKGKNYGWPVITYGVEYGTELKKIGAGATVREGMEQPLYYWDPVIAPGAMTYYNGALFPAWKDSIFVAGLASGYVARLTLQGEKVVGEERLTFSTNPERYRNIAQGPDGALYVLTDAPARLLKIVPKK